MKERFDKNTVARIVGKSVYKYFIYSFLLNASFISNGQDKYCHYAHSLETAF